MGEAEVEGAVERARRGDPEAFAELHRRLGARVLGLCRHLLGSPEAAEDARSEVFLRLQQALDSYDPAQPFPRWLLSVASHHCVDLLRRRRVESRLFAPVEADRVAEVVPAPEPSPLGRLLVEERRDEVRQAIGRLPDRYRVPLVLRYYGDMSYEEIAAALSLKRNHVATLIFRAKQELRATLGARGQGAEA